MTSYVAGQRLKAISRRSSATVYALSQRAGDHARRRGAADRGCAARRRHSSSTCCNSRSSRAIREPRSPRPARSVLTESEARRLFGTEDVGRPDADDGHARRLRRLSGHRRRPRPAAQQPCPLHASSRASTSPRFMADTPQIPDLLGLAVGLVSISRCGPAPTRRRSSAACRPGSGATSPTRLFGEAALQPGRRAGLAARQHPRHPPRRGAGRGDDAGQRPAHDRHLRHHRLPDPRHGLRQLHQSRHRPRQPARPRSGAAEGARRQPPAADHPVPRRIGADRRHRDAARAGAGRAAAAVALAPSSMPTSAMHYFGADGMLLPILVLVARWSARPAASIRPSTCRASSRRRC